MQRMGKTRNRGKTHFLATLTVAAMLIPVPSVLTGGTVVEAASYSVPPRQLTTSAVVVPFTHGSEPQGQNIAVGKPSWAGGSPQSGPQSGSQSASNATSPASNANDGSASTYWYSAGNQVNPTWTVNLQGYYTLTGVGVEFAQPGKYFQYEIQVSQDNRYWRTVVNARRNTNTSPLQYNDFHASHVRFVRIVFIGLAAGQTASLAEFDAYSLTHGINIAAGRVASADSSAPGTTPGMAVDAQLSTIWKPDVQALADGQGSAQSSEQGPADNRASHPSHWLAVDLGSIYKLTGVKVTWAALGSHKFRIEVSSDNLHWKPVQASLGSESLRTSDMATYVRFAESVHAQYVRIVVFAPDTMSKVGSAYLDPPQATSNLSDTTNLAGSAEAIAKFAVYTPFLAGADLSMLQAEENHGAVYSQNGVAMNPMQIFQMNGVNYVRLRLWVNPPGGLDNLQQVTKLATEAKQHGMKVLLDLHYSDFWADPSKQTIPAAWQGQSYTQLQQTVEAYTQSVVQTLTNAGAAPSMVAIGNEITGGMLWPIGKDYGTPYGFTRLAGLVQSGINGVRAAQEPGKHIKIMIHIDRGGDNGGARWFFDNLMAAGVHDFDVIGLSYYPFWHGTLANMRANLTDLATRYGKDIVIAETQYPWTLANGDTLANNVSSASQLLPNYPATPTGQERYMEDLMAIVHSLPNGRGLGVFYWGPDWIPTPGVGWEPGAGNPSDNLTMFNFNGQALRSIHVFGRYSGTPSPLADPFTSPFADPTASAALSPWTGGGAQ